MSEHDTGETQEQAPSPAAQYPPPQGRPVQAPVDPQPPAPAQTPVAAPPPTPASQAAPPQEPATQTPPPVAPPTAVGAPPPPPSLLDRAKADDQEAIATMFAQFLPRGERVLEGHYLGVLGFWGIGTHSFAAVTPRRIATMRLSLLGGVQYQDGSLEYVNSAAVYQPSKVMLYVYAAAISLVFFVYGLTVHPAAAIGLLILSFLLLPLTARVYYRFKKSGIVLWIREGLQLYAFIDRRRMRVSNQLYRMCTDLREERLRALGHP
jgi:hypothetical protein